MSPQADWGSWRWVVESRLVGPLKWEELSDKSWVDLWKKGVVNVKSLKVAISAFVLFLMFYSPQRCNSFLDLSLVSPLFCTTSSVSLLTSNPVTLHTMLGDGGVQGGVYLIWDVSSMYIYALVRSCFFWNNIQWSCLSMFKIYRVYDRRVWGFLFHIVGKV